jgi:hypothetical protein
VGIASLAPGLFRRSRERFTRTDAIQDLFGVTSSIIDAVAQLKPEWREQWQRRVADELPPRYELLDARTADAVRDLRFARSLLQRNRWRSQVEPIFSDGDEQAWRVFASIAGTTTAALLHVREAHQARFLGDELDWIDDAIEQFSDARRQILRAENLAFPLSRRASEGAYLHVYLAIQLSERFIERVRMEAAERGR